MNLQGLRFNFAFDQSGVRNFDGRGYPYHKWMPNLSFNNCSFVSKTTTLNPRRGKNYNEDGNMPLRDDYMTPSEFKPRCIHVDWRCFRQGIALNAVGLSGPGLRKLLTQGTWHFFREPFQISVTAVATTLEDRLSELEQMVALFLRFPLPGKKFAIQLNISCPNVGHGHPKIAEMIWETKSSLGILSVLGVPLLVKVNALFPVPAAAEICLDSNCAGLCNSNTIPWAQIPAPDRIRMFGTEESPLYKLGGGGLSGSYLLPLVVKWLKEARAAGITKPIIAGGGILKPDDVNQLAEAGASAIAVGSAAFLRPWRVQDIIDRANRLGAARWFF